MRALVAALSMALLAAPVAYVTPAQAAPSLIRSVLFMGDSIAFDLAPAVDVGLEAAGLDVTTYTFAGISLSGSAYLPDGQTWLEDHIRHELEKSHASVVVWQLSAWDLPGQRELNRLAHERFVELALPQRVAVVFVTAPPLDADVYPWWSEDWRGLGEVAGGLAADHPGRVFVADASAAWGDTFVEFAGDGRPLRKPDGVHVCPDGAAVFADFLARWLDERFAGVAPAEPSAWPDGWRSDSRYDLPPDACSARSIGS